MLNVVTVEPLGSKHFSMTEFNIKTIVKTYHAESNSNNKTTASLYP